MNEYYLKNYNIYQDQEAYRKYPQHSKWFNKLWLSKTLGYDCGPCGVAPQTSTYYVVRPIMNLSGMGVGAKKKYIEKDDLTQVPPGYFWSRWFNGNQYSATFDLDQNGNRTQVSCWKATRDARHLYKFYKWNRVDHVMFDLPELFDQLHDVPTINVEFIGNKIIEVHLRKSPDPDYDEFIPIWKGEEETIDIYEKMGYRYITNYDDADGFLETPRLGFVVK